MLTVLTWLWRQTPDKARYFDDAGGADKVNVWNAMVRRNCTLDIELACVTDEPEGIAPDVRIIPLPRPFDDVEVKAWREKIGAPQCYRRLMLFHPDAAEVFGAERFVSMDLDCVVTGNLDRLWDNDCPFVMFKGTSNSRPYNGSMIQMDAGARPEVYERFARDPQGVAEAARRKFIGSDQAVISHVLGPGEERWSARDGVEAYGGGFLRRHGGQPHRVRLGEDTRIVFFPGRTKPWDLLDRVAFVNDHWHDGVPRGRAVHPQTPSRRPRSQPAPLYAYDDRKGWGREFKAAADRTKHGRVKLFVRDKRVPDGGRAFVRLDQQGTQREVSRGIVEALYRRHVVTLPTHPEMLWYDDKVAQFDALRAWMPDTHVLKGARADAEALLDDIDSYRLGGYPFVSKAAEGASSANVRLIRSRAEAERELDKAFGPGIELSYGRFQRGYVYWQRLVPDNPCDYRVCVVGPYLYGLVRRNRPDSFTASGSGDHYALTLADERERRAAELCIEIAQSIGTRWMAFDVVYDETGRPLVLEMSSAWTMKSYRHCPMFDFDMKKADLTGASSFRVALDVLRELPQQVGDRVEDEPQLA